MILEKVHIFNVLEYLLMDSDFKRVLKNRSIWVNSSKLTFELFEN